MLTRASDLEPRPSRRAEEPEPRPPRAAARRLCRVLLALSFAACTRNPSAPPVRPSEARPGGSTSVSIAPRPSYTLPAANLSESERPKFYAGRALARQPWVRAPSITDARDGLGPLYNARSCLACHVDGGRGPAPSEDGRLPRSSLVRLSLSGFDQVLGVVPEPTYGTQLQVQSVALAHQLRGVRGVAEALDTRIPAEGAARVIWTKERFVYPDGRTVELRKPEVALEGLAYGALHPETRIGLRHAPPLHGLGLLDLIPEADLRALADPADEDGDGISGRPNQVWDPEANETRWGRFGHKANQPSLRVQVAAALRDDMGITNPVFPTQVCTEAQPACQSAPHGNGEDGYEISDALLTVMLDFATSIGVPERRKPDHPMVRAGRELFFRAGCQDCHTPRFVTGRDPSRPYLSEQEIWPYSDLLLHDMGEGLADGRSDHLASGSEWRTPPLWSVGLARAVNAETGFLHDGRARSVEEAILWHGGEARTSRDRFIELNAEDRRRLIAFVRSL